MFDSINILYWIDKIIGSLLCAIVDVCYYVQKMCKRQAITAIKNIVFIQLSELGCIVLSSPTVREVKRQYPHANLYFVTFKHHVNIFKILKDISPENVMSIRINNVFLMVYDCVIALQRLRKLKIDVAFDFEFFSRFSSLLAYLSGAKIRIGFCQYTFGGLYRGRHFTRGVLYNPRIHMAAMFFNFLEAQGNKNETSCATAKAENELCLPKSQIDRDEYDRAEQQVKQCLKDDSISFVLIQLGGGKLALREWPYEYFKKLVTLIVNETEYVPIFVGNKSTTKKTRTMVEEINSKKCINMTNQLSLIEIFILCERASAFVLCDSGIAHVASLTSVPMVVLFGPESPQIFSPISKNVYSMYAGLACSPCFSVLNFRQSKCSNNECMKALKPEQVFEKLLRIKK